MLLAVAAKSRALRGSAAASVLFAACVALVAPDDPERALRAELVRLLPEADEAERVVPFEIDAATAAFAKRVAEPYRGAEARARAILVALTDPAQGLALRYEWGLRNSARETLAARAGTCMGLSSVLVGMARAAGLRASYLDATELSELREDGGFRVIAGHVAVRIETARRPLYVDFTGEMLPEARYRVIDDLGATARYYNNRAYERLLLAERAGKAPPWEDARLEYERAVRIAPDFAAGWNNLGVALARLGRIVEAETSYRRALALDPGFLSPGRNLEALERHARRSLP